jgi:cytidine deaminase
MDPEGIEELIQAAQTVMERAYAPYSGFRVGAALRGSEGTIFTGCNVENASYGLTICAERVALFKAVSEGVRSFLVLALVSDSEEPIPPCGACLSVLSEFGLDLPIVSVGKTGKRTSWTLRDLLPHVFHPGETGSPRSKEGRLL